VKTKLIAPRIAAQPLPAGKTENVVALVPAEEIADVLPGMKMVSQFVPAD